ncbi:bifunctional 4-hydroxy-2-oxoglutarate aldolase/2-dehydro-3-deoxy-phosphogluconate aldolase [Bacteroidota bacterium]
MARFTRLEVYNTMKDNGIVPVFYNPDIEVCKKILMACYKGGSKIFEFTNRGDFAHEVFTELNKFAIKEAPEMILGVGSIVDAGTTSLYIQLGANFIVSPVLKEDMALVCNRRKIAWSPGAGSLNEISRAEELGAEIVKIFPGAQVGGPGFVKTIKAPCPWTDIMPTGGVKPTEENLTEWFEAGVFCAGMGSQLMIKDENGNFDYKAIEEKTREAIKIIKEIKSKK